MGGQLCPDPEPEPEPDSVDLCESHEGTEYTDGEEGEREAGEDGSESESEKWTNESRAEIESLLLLVE